MINTNLPLVDLHRHLDGNIAPATVWELGKQHNIELPGNSLEEFIPHAQVQGQSSDLLGFLQKLDYGVAVLADYDAIYRVAYENVEDAKAQQLDYTELRFSPHYMAMAFNLDMTEVVNVVADAVAAGSRDFGVKTNLIGILSRTFGVETCMAELNAILAHKDKVIALDLAGDEYNFPCNMFVEHFNTARDAGLQVTVHAGEAAGPESIWDAIKLLGATRIGHCVASAKAPDLLDYLVDNNIAIESCPTSNFQTAAISDIKDHPLRTFYDHGVIVCLNTDDPAVSGIDIINEYRVAQETLGMNADELSQIQLNGVKAAFLSDSEKQALIDSKAR
jgi:adenosine deaminase